MLESAYCCYEAEILRFFAFCFQFCFVEVLQFAPKNHNKFVRYVQTLAQKYVTDTHLLVKMEGISALFNAASRICFGVLTNRISFKVNSYQEVLQYLQTMFTLPSFFISFRYLAFSWPWPLSTSPCLTYMLKEPTVM